MGGLNQEINPLINKQAKVYFKASCIIFIYFFYKSPYIKPLINIINSNLQVVDRIEVYE